MEFYSSQQETQAKASKIKLLLLDVDGILTDGRLYYSSSGEETKAFNSLDGHGIKMLMRAGVEVGILTGRKSEIVARRAKELGIRILIQGREDKDIALHEMLSRESFELEEIAYAGDDYPDLAVLELVALGFTVPNGHDDLRAVCDAITGREGGAGAVREICDFLLAHRV